LEQELLDVGVPGDQLDAAETWLDEVFGRGDVLYRNVFRRPSVVEEFVGRWAPSVQVLGAALPRDDVEEFLAVHDEQIPQDDGIIEMLCAGEPLTPGYTALGYEPVEVTWGGFGSSWTINGLQTGVEAATGVTPNPGGLISTLDEARAVIAYLSRPDVPKEPGIWRAWLVVTYPRQ
jgi:hypothetical protein